MLLNLFARRVILQDRLARRISVEVRFDDTTDAICNRVIKYYTNVKGAIGPNKEVSKTVDAEANVEDVFKEACAIIDETLAQLRCIQE